MPRAGGPSQLPQSLATLLHEAANELLRVGLEDTVDLVENRVDVGVVVLLAGAGLRRRRRGLRRVVRRVIPALWSALLLTGHVRHSALMSTVPAVKPSATLARSGGQLAQEGGGVWTAVQQ